MAGRAAPPERFTAASTEASRIEKGFEYRIVMIPPFHRQDSREPYEGAQLRVKIAASLG
ncbi:MAG: hypothetical protein M0D55_14535 [Elusimicrobiota bacterium]|nr:MAG: hypothetical protein M0D55_14535 [Elusimicrobiota bacterium]